MNQEPIDSRQDDFDPGRDQAYEQNQQPEDDSLDRYLDEYRKTLSAFAVLAHKFPDMVGELRRVLKISSMMTFSNIPGFRESYQETSQEVDDFLKRIEAGELNADDFITEEDDRKKAERE